MTPIPRQNVSIERLLKKIFYVLLAIMFVGYAYFQARNLIQGPSIALTEEPHIVTNERTIPISGIAKNIIALRLNGLQIHTDERGLFTHSLFLENGYSIMTLEAEDRYGRVTRLTRSFVFTPEPT